MKYSAYGEPADCRKLTFQTEPVGGKYEHRYANFIITDEAGDERNHLGRVTLTRSQIVELVGEMVTWLGRP